MRRLLPVFSRMQFICSIEFVNRARGGFERSYSWLDGCCSVPLLIVDDLGVERMTDYSFEVWFKLIDERYGNLKPTVFTSNLKLSDLSKRFDDRIASRLADGKVLNIDGKDYRVE